MNVMLAYRRAFSLLRENFLLSEIGRASCRERV